MQKVIEIVRRSFPLGKITESSLASGTQVWRERIYNAMMFTILYWGWIAIIPSVWLSLVSDLWSVAIADILAYLAVIFLYLLRDKLDYKARAPIFLLIGLSIGVTILLLTGDEGAGFLWIFAVPPFASLLVDLRWGLAFELINVAILSALGFLIHLGLADSIRISEFTVGSWIVYCANFLLAESIVTVPLGVLLDGLFQATHQQQRRLDELEAIGKVSATLRESDDLDETLPHLLQSVLEIFDVDAGSIWLYDPNEDLVKMAYSIGYAGGDGDEIVIAPEKPGTGLAGMVFANNQAFISVEYAKDERLPLELRRFIPAGNGGATVVIRAQQTGLGVINVSTPSPRVFTKFELTLLKTLADIAGTAIQRTQFHKKTEKQLKQFQSLAEIDRVILASFDLKYNLKVLLDNIQEELEVEAANMMVYDPEIDRLRSVVGQGFSSDSFQDRTLPIGEGHAGWVAQSRRPMYIDNLTEHEDNPKLQRALSGEHFTSYYAVPLIAKGTIRGVLELFNSKPMNTDAEWTSTLNALAGRAAIAIDSLRIFESLQETNQELNRSYDATIEGWSAALDLRDRETEGHSKRVTELSMRLARKLGLQGDQLVNIYRGALLHDIGKMGIPDRILHKPGALTEDEWIVMRKHPTYAYDMLKSVEYLKGALDIPYCHHEKWDGSGYPQGLAGEEIPLAARVFALADVYDALTSDRPYRRAWSKAKTMEYIRQQAGIHFDPKLVDPFLSLDLPG